MKVIANADSRYYNKYTASTGIAGDGMGKFGNALYLPSSSGPLLIRSNSGVLSSSADTGSRNSGNGSRAVVVCGTGL